MMTIGRVPASPTTASLLQMVQPPASAPMPPPAITTKPPLFVTTTRAVPTYMAPAVLTQETVRLGPAPNVPSIQPPPSPVPPLRVNMPAEIVQPAPVPQLMVIPDAELMPVTYQPNPTAWGVATGLVFVGGLVTTGLVGYFLYRSLRKR